MSREPTTPDRTARDSAAPDSEAIVNWDEALSIVAGKQDLLLELVEIFLNEGPRLVGVAQQALADHDGGALQIAAHTLKGNARYFGAQPAAEAAFAVERCAAQGELDTAAPLLARLASRIDQLLPELRAYANRTAGEGRSSGASD